MGEVGGGGVNEVWERARDGLLKAAGDVCGWTKGPKRHSQTWWWNKEVEEKVQEKRTRFKQWQKKKGTDEEDDAFAKYVIGKKAAKKAVKQAQQLERKKFGERLDTVEGRKAVFRIAKQMAREKRDVVGVNCLKDEKGAAVVEPEKVKERWKGYMEGLLNVENDWDGIVDGEKVEIGRAHV